MVKPLKKRQPLKYPGAVSYSNDFETWLIAGVCHFGIFLFGSAIPVRMPVAIAVGGNSVQARLHARRCGLDGGYRADLDDRLRLLLEHQFLVDLADLGSFLHGL